jgi:hypothetical protein
MPKTTTISLSHLRAKQLCLIAKHRGVPVSELLHDFIATQSAELGIKPFHDASRITTPPAKKNGELRVKFDLKDCSLSLLLDRDHKPRTPPRDLISITEAAALIQPFLEGLNANNWLSDMRRVAPVYRARVLTPPRWIKHESRITYPKSEIVRLVDEISLVKEHVCSIPSENVERTRSYSRRSRS